MEHSNKNISNQYSEHLDEFDLVGMLKILWKGRKQIIKITLTFIGIGLLLAVTSPEEYTSTVVVKPTISDSKSKLGSSLGGLAAMAGVSLKGNNSAAEIHPTLYPKIIESYSFQKELMDSPIYVADLNSAVSFEKYYTKFHRGSLIGLVKKYTLGLPRLLLSKINSKGEHAAYSENEFYTISETDKSMMKRLRSQLKVNVDQKDGFVSISVSMPDKLQAAQMVSSAQNILQRKVINYKLKKAEEDLSFIEERFNEKKKAFEKAQENLAKYRDANKNVNTATAQTEAERLESEYQLAFSVYSELAKQVETQKIQVKENTPVFAVLQEAVVPLEKSSTPKLSVIGICSFLGIVVGVGFIFAKKYVEDIKKKWEA